MSDDTLRQIQSLDAQLQPLALNMINTLRDYGLPAVVTSGRRSAAHNRDVGGAVNSKHLVGRAFDIGFIGYTVKKLPQPFLDALGQFGEGMGLRWGGRFRPPDPGHFDL